MSVAKKDSKKITVKTLQTMADKGEKIAMITAYDYSMAKLVDMLMEADRYADVKKATKAPEYRDKLMKEYKLVG